MIDKGEHCVRLILPDQQERYFEKIDLSEVYQKIRNAEPLCLNGVVLEGFSVKAYREYYQLSSDEMIVIKIDSITDCLFLGKDGIALDLSECQLESPDPITGISFENNIFYSGNICFCGSYIVDADLSLKGCSFWNAELYFDFAKFDEKDLYLNKTSFYGQESAIHFIETDFGESGELFFHI